MTPKPKIPHGRQKKPEADDPLELVMTAVPGGNSKIMLECLTEEYARMGMGEEEIFRLFSQPCYRTHTLYQAYGELRIRNLIREVLGRVGRMRISVKISPQKGGADA